MKFDGITIKNYRSFDNEGICLNDLGQINIIVGKNNSGKSNLLKFIGELSHYYRDSHTRIMDIHDYFDQNLENKISWSLLLKKNHSGFNQVVFSNPFLKDLFEEYESLNFTFELDQRKTFVFDSTFPASLKLNQKKLTDLSLKYYGNSSYGDITQILGLLHNIKGHLEDNIFLISTDRQIREDRENTNDPLVIASNFVNGINLINRIDRIKNPKSTNREDKKKFVAIENFFKSILNEKNLEIEISSEQPKELSLNINGNVKRIENLGTGISQLFILSLAIATYDNVIFCIEEPEIFLHPEIQKKFIRFLANTNNQYFIATHSNAFMNIEKLDIYHFIHDGVKTKVEKVKSSKDRNSLLDDLGYSASDLLQSNFIIWVEGPSDRVYINYWLKALDTNLVEGIDYSIMFYGGRLLSHLSIDENAISDFINLKRINRNTGIIIDSDKENDGDKINNTKMRIIKEFSDSQSFAWVTDGREIENYLPEKIFSKGVEEIHKTKSAIEYNKFTKITRLNKEKTIDKVAMAHFITNQTADLEVLDLKEKIQELLDKIRIANNTK